jgi:hypothetical protein
MSTEKPKYWLNVLCLNFGIPPDERYFFLLYYKYSRKVGEDESRRDG